MDETDGADTMTVGTKNAARAVLAGLLVLGACGGPTPSLTTVPEGPSTSTSPRPAPTSGEYLAPSPGATTSPGSPPATNPSAETIPPTTAASVVIGEVPEGLISDVIADASDRSGVPLEAIAVVRGEFVVWPDGSLGCPVPGEVYTQATVEGYWIVLSAAGDEYDYRATAAGYFKLCEGGGLPSQPDA